MDEASYGLVISELKVFKFILFYHKFYHNLQSQSTDFLQMLRNQQKAQRDTEFILAL